VSATNHAMLLRTRLIQLIKVLIYLSRRKLPVKIRNGIHEIKKTTVFSNNKFY
jgi:hypothetical protein